MTNDERDKLINSILPDTVKGQQRPAENINPDMPYSTDFPQLINKDPASADVFNLVNRQLLSNDKSLNNSKADKTYVDKKVADLVNGAPEQLDTLQELSKALNNDKDYATTVNNALAEKLGKREKAESAGTADSATKANTLTGFTRDDGHSWGNKTGELVANFYLGDGAEIAFRKNNPSTGKTALLIDGIVYQREGLFECIDENSINDYLKNYLPLIGGAITGSVISQDKDGRSFTIRGGTETNDAASSVLQLINRENTGDPVEDNRGAFALRTSSNSSTGGAPHYFVGRPNGTLTWDAIDLAGAGIVSQQLGQEMSYIKYANGLLVQKLKSDISKGENITGGCKVHLTLPVAFKDDNYAAYTTVQKGTLSPYDGPFICYFIPVSASGVDIFITNGRNNKDFYNIYVVCIGTWK